MTAADRQRKIAALRALAERPGTPAEGETARAMLAKLEAQQPEASESEYDGLKFAFGVGFDPALFQQAMRDARAAMFKMAEEQERERYYGGFSYSRPRPSTQSENRANQERDELHARMQREEKEARQQAFDDAQRRAREASAKGQFHTSFADAVDETYRTGETLAEVFARKKAEWAAQQRAGNPLPYGANFVPPREAKKK